MGACTSTHLDNDVIMAVQVKEEEEPSKLTCFEDVAALYPADFDLFSPSSWAAIQKVATLFTKDDFAQFPKYTKFPLEGTLFLENHTGRMFVWQNCRIMMNISVGSVDSIKFSPKNAIETMFRIKKMANEIRALEDLQI